MSMVQTGAAGPAGADFVDEEAIPDEGGAFEVAIEESAEPRPIRNCSAPLWLSGRARENKVYVER